MAGRRIVQMVTEDLRMSRILTRQAFENAIMVNGAIGGSTNAVVHLLAVAGRIGVDLSLDDWDRLGREMPCLVNLMPSGQYLMEDFYYAGGLPVVMKEIGARLHLDALTVNGRTVGENVKDAVNWNPRVITPLGQVFQNVSLKRLEASEVATFSNGSPVLTLVWGVWFFEEAVTLALTIGGNSAPETIDFWLIVTS